jgi:hypothetical protein
MVNVQPQASDTSGIFKLSRSAMEHRVKAQEHGGNFCSVCLFSALFPLTLGEREKHLAALVNGLTAVAVPWQQKRKLVR